MRFLWERAGWPHFTFDSGSLLAEVTRVRLAQGQLLGTLRGLQPPLQLDAELAVGIADVLATSAIEGEALSPASVRSSIGERLGLAHAGVGPRDRHVDGLVEVVLDATVRAFAPLTEQRLLGWHGALFPTGRSGLTRIAVARYRDDAGGPMQVVSAVLSRAPVVHFEAPPAGRLKREVKALLQWLDGAARREDGLVASGLAHLWFVTLHPFDDGNGRLARALADHVLARADGLTQRFWSMSAQLQRERADYYRALEAAQRGTLDVTAWLRWYVGCFARSVDHAQEVVARVLLKHDFWQAQLGAEPLTLRQQRMVTRLLEQDEWSVTVKQWAKATRCSTDTAQRDIDDLVRRSVLAKGPVGGPRTDYRFVWTRR